MLDAEHVRFRGQSGHRGSVAMSANDPKRTFFHQRRASRALSNNHACSGPKTKAKVTGCTACQADRRLRRWLLEPAHAVADRSERDARIAVRWTSAQVELARAAIEIWIALDELADELASHFVSGSRAGRPLVRSRSSISRVCSATVTTMQRTASETEVARRLRIYAALRRCQNGSRGQRRSRR